jgi:hypothetical protein
MSRLTSLCVLSFVMFSGCVVVRPPYRSEPPPPRRVVVHEVREVREVPECRPNQYWDGEECRHKGNGHGARKHDDD